MKSKVTTLRGLLAAGALLAVMGAGTASATPMVDPVRPGAFIRPLYLEQSGSAGFSAERAYLLDQLEQYSRAKLCNFRITHFR
jgi:hypothetical protein